MSIGHNKDKKKIVFGPNPFTEEEMASYLATTMPPLVRRYLTDVNQRVPFFGNGVSTQADITAPPNQDTLEKKQRCKK